MALTAAQQAQIKHCKAMLRAGLATQESLLSDGYAAAAINAAQKEQT